MWWVRFMASGAGRAVRIVAGVALIGTGLGVVGGTAGYTMAGIGLLPLTMGALNLCIIAPFLGCPVRGSAVR